MPRRPRHSLPHVPLHIVQRGVNRQDCFLSTQDYRSYLAALLEVSAEFSVSIHAYVLMTNHVHILATPSEDMGVSRMMQQLGRKYVSNFNRKHIRTGTLWEGRFRSSMISSSKYLFACHRYIELNPVRAQLVQSPEQYRWSSYRANALGDCDDVLTPHREILQLADEVSSRRKKYRRLFGQTNDDLDEEIRSACRKCATLE